MSRRTKAGSRAWIFKVYSLPGPKKFGVLSIFEVSLPALIDSIGSQKVAVRDRRECEGAHSRFLRWASTLRPENGFCFRSATRTMKDGKATASAKVSGITEIRARTGCTVEAPLPAETVSLIDMW